MGQMIDFGFWGWVLNYHQNQNYRQQKNCTIIWQPELTADCGSVDTTGANVTSTLDMLLIFIVDVMINDDW